MLYLPVILAHCLFPEEISVVVGRENIVSRLYKLSTHALIRGGNKNCSNDQASAGWSNIMFNLSITRS